MGPANDGLLTSWQSVRVLRSAQVAEHLSSSFRLDRHGMGFGPSVLPLSQLLCVSESLMKDLSTVIALLQEVNDQEDTIAASLFRKYGKPVLPAPQQSHE